MKISQNVGDCHIEADFSKLEKLLKDLDVKGYVDVGVLGNASYEDGATIAGIGAIHEFGSLSGNIPQRSFIRMPIELKQEDIEKKVMDKVKDKLFDGISPKDVLQMIGIFCEEAIQEAFETGGFGTWQDIKDETKDRKNGDSILIDTGTLRKAITSKIGGF